MEEDASMSTFLNSGSFTNLNNEDASVTGENLRPMDQVPSAVSRISYLICPIK